MRYTLGEAAKVTGRSKATLSRAIKNGVLSAEKQANGSYHIEASELFRVYPGVRPEQLAPPFDETPGATPEVRELRAKLEAMAEVKARLENECADLRRRLDAESEERRRTQSVLTGLLTDRGEKREPAGPEPKRGFWRRLFAPRFT